MTVTLLGFPWDTSSSYSRGPAHGPAIIRTMLTSEASSPYSISGVDIKDAITEHDFTELPSDGPDARNAITTRTAQAIENGKALSLGGDHSITYPVLRAFKEKYGPVNILHIDAHTDLYDEFEGDRYSHASPFARAIEDGCVGKLVQIGLRSVGPEQRKFGVENGVTMLGADDIDNIPYAALIDPLYVSIDLDGLDPAYAPGVSHPEPGGLSTREVLAIIKKLQTSPVGADIVEYNPERDTGLITAHVAARLVKELVAIMA